MHLTETNHIGMRGGAAGRTTAVAVPACSGRCPAVRAGEPHAAGDHRPEVLVVGEVDEEVDGGVEDLEHVADVDEIKLDLQQTHNTITVVIMISSSQTLLFFSTL